jgi:hypothetical protein
MDLNTIDQVITRATKTWNTAARNEIIHVRYKKSEVLFLQGSAAQFWWQATIMIGPRGSIRGELITMDPSQEILADQLFHTAAPGGNSIGPLHVPKGTRRTELGVRAAKSVLNQMLIKSKDEHQLASQIAHHRMQVIQTSGGSSIGTLRG